jgi:hypothetical protein
MQNKSW